MKKKMPDLELVEVKDGSCTVWCFGLIPGKKYTITADPFMEPDTFIALHKSLFITLPYDLLKAGLLCLVLKGEGEHTRVEYYYRKAPDPDQGWQPVMRSRYRQRGMVSIDFKIALGIYAILETIIIGLVILFSYLSKGSDGTALMRAADICKAIAVGTAVAGFATLHEEAHKSVQPKHVLIRRNELQPGKTYTFRFLTLEERELTERARRGDHLAYETLLKQSKRIDKDKKD